MASSYPVPELPDLALPRAREREVPRVAERSEEAVSARVALGFVGAALLAQTVYAGIRFVDGSVLLALAQDGFSAQIPVLGQYLFDSPLKVLVLWLAAPEAYLPIALLFSATALLPFLAFRLCFGKAAFLGALVVFSLTPALKMLVQTIGVGDGVTIALYTVALFGSWMGAAAAASALLPLWHFQQGVLVIVFAAIVLFLRNEAGDRRRMFVTVLGFGVGAAIFVAYKLFAAPPVISRADWVLQAGQKLLAKNLYGLPIILGSMACVSLLLLTQRDAIQRGALRVALAGIAVVAVAVSMLATDASRVLLLLLLPVVFLLLEGRIRSGELVRDLRARPELYAALAFACALVPLYSWSGVDIYLWPDLLADLRKYL